MPDDRPGPPARHRTRLGHPGSAPPDLEVRGDNGEVIICRSEQGHWPEDYIAVEEKQGCYIACEAHRDKKAVRAEDANEDEAALLATVPGRRMFRAEADPGTARQIRGYAGQGPVSWQTAWTSPCTASGRKTRPGCRR